MDVTTLAGEPTRLIWRSSTGRTEISIRDGIVQVHVLTGKDSLSRVDTHTLINALVHNNQYGEIE